MAASPRIDGTASMAGRVTTVPLQVDAWSGAMSASLGLTADRLSEFSRKMALHGIAVEPARFFFDSFYAYRRLALAHATDDDPLKQMTVEMTERYRALERRRHNFSAFSRPH